MSSSGLPADVGSNEGLGVWVPCSLRLPEAETDVLALVVFGASVRYAVAGMFAACAKGPVEWYSFESPDDELMVTHWMPLPQMPIKTPNGVLSGAREDAGETR